MSQTLTSILLQIHALEQQIKDAWKTAHGPSTDRQQPPAEPPSEPPSEPPAEPHAAQLDGGPPAAARFRSIHDARSIDDVVHCVDTLGFDIHRRTECGASFLHTCVVNREEQTFQYVRDTYQLDTADLDPDQCEEPFRAWILEDRMSLDEAIERGCTDRVLDKCLRRGDVCTLDVDRLRRILPTSQLILRLLPTNHANILHLAIDSGREDLVAVLGWTCMDDAALPRSYRVANHGVSARLMSQRSARIPDEQLPPVEQWVPIFELLAAIPHVHVDVTTGLLEHASKAQNAEAVAWLLRCSNKPRTYNIVPEYWLKPSFASQLIRCVDVDSLCSCSHLFMTYVVRHASVEAIRGLVERGFAVDRPFDVVRRYQFQSNLIMEAAAHNRMDLLQLFRSMGVSLLDRYANKLTLLAFPCFEGHADMVRYLVEQGVDMNAEFEYSDDWRSALCISVSAGHVPIVDYLLGRGASRTTWDSRNYRGMRVSCLVAAVTNPSVMKHLVEQHGFDVNEPRGGDRNLLTCSIPSARGRGCFFDERTEVSEYLLRRGVDTSVACSEPFLMEQITESATDDALRWVGSKLGWRHLQKISLYVKVCKTGNTDILKLLLEHPMSTSAITSYRSDESDRKMSLFHMACTSQYFKHAFGDLLLHLFGSQILQNSDNMMRLTPLHVAAWSCGGNVQTCSFLLERGASIHAKCSSGRTPIMYVTNVHTIQLLLTYGVTAADCVDASGTTMLHRLPHGSYDQERTPQVLQTLLDRGLSIHAVDHNGRTALHEGCSYLYRDPRFVEMFVRAGANINAKDKDGKTPIFHLIRWFRRELYDTWIALGADMGATDNNGDSILHEIARLHYGMGFDVDMRMVRHVNKLGQTPLHVVYNLSHPFAKTLVDAGCPLDQKDGRGQTAVERWERYDDEMVSLARIIPSASIPCCSKGRTLFQFAVDERKDALLVELIKREFVPTDGLRHLLSMTGYVGERLRLFRRASTDVMRECVAACPSEDAARLLVLAGAVLPSSSPHCALSAPSKWFARRIWWEEKAGNRRRAELMKSFRAHAVHCSFADETGARSAVSRCAGDGDDDRAAFGAARHESGMYYLEGCEWREQIGEGAFAVIHAGMWRGRPVAIKVFKTWDTDAMRDVQLQSSICHDNVAVFLGVTRCDATQRIGIVMELCAGGTLLSAHDRLPLAAKMRALCSITDVFISHPSFVHGDVKPDNMLLTDSCEHCLLTDVSTSSFTKSYARMPHVRCREADVRAFVWSMVAVWIGRNIEMEDHEDMDRCFESMDSRTYRTVEHVLPLMKRWLASEGRPPTWWDVRNALEQCTMCDV